MYINNVKNSTPPPSELIDEINPKRLQHKDYVDKHNKFNTYKYISDNNEHVIVYGINKLGAKLLLELADNDILSAVFLPYVNDNVLAAMQQYDKHISVDNDTIYIDNKKYRIYYRLNDLTHDYPQHSIVYADLTEIIYYRIYNVNNNKEYIFNHTICNYDKFYNEICMIYDNLDGVESKLNFIFFVTYKMYGDISEYIAYVNSDYYDTLIDLTRKYVLNNNKTLDVIYTGAGIYKLTDCEYLYLIASNVNKLYAIEPYCKGIDGIKQLIELMNVNNINIYEYYLNSVNKPIMIGKKADINNYHFTDSIITMHKMRKNIELKSDIKNILNECDIAKNTTTLNDLFKNINKLDAIIIGDDNQYLTYLGASELINKFKPVIISRWQYDNDDYILLPKSLIQDYNYNINFNLLTMHQPLYIAY